MIRGVLRFLGSFMPTQPGDLTVSQADGKARIYRSAAVCVLEDQGNRGVASGYASLTSSALVPTAQLGTGTADATTFLRGDGTWAAGGGGGTMDHAALSSNLAWGTSGHTSTANRLAGFDGSGNAAAVTLTAPLSLSSSALSVSVFTGDTGSGGTTGLVPAPSAGDGLAGKYLAADGTWTQLPAGLVTFWLDPADSSNIATYKTALVAPATTAETTLAVGATGTSDNLLAAFATDPTIPGVTLLPHGVVSFHLHCATGAANEVARLKVEIYTCNSSGGSETLRGSSYSDNFWDASQEVNTDVTLSSGYALATTDRLVFKVSAARVSGPATCNITVYFNGATRPASVLTTIGALTPQLVGAQPLDAGLTSLTAADASAGLPYVTAANTWASATYSGMLSVVSAAWKVVGLRESGGQDLGMGAVADGSLLSRSGTSVVGTTPDTVVSDAAGANGIVTRTASGAVTARALTAGDGITVTNGDGVSGNPTVAVQASVKGFQLYQLFTVIQPQGGVVPNVDGVGSTITSAGLYTTNVSEAGFPCTQYGDGAASGCRFYVSGAFHTDVGTTTTDILFKMGSDIAAGITVVFIGFSSNASLSTGDPSGHRYAIRWLRGTDTNWQLATKDNVTQNLVDTGVVVTADYYYAVRFVCTSSSVDVQISASATVAGAKSGIDAAGTTTSSTNMPTSTTDMYAILSMQRSAASTSRCLKFGYWRTIQVP